MPIEVEVKSLLGKQAAADAFIESIDQFNPELIEISNQLNHYFIGDDIDAVARATKALFSDAQQQELTQIVNQGQNHSVRTRQLNDLVLLVIKASIDETTSSNGITRLEFEHQVQLSLNELDQKILAAGYEYQAKWSRHRQLWEVVFQGTKVFISLDKNAGYGYLAEFEIGVDHQAQVADARAKIDALMRKLDVQELSQDRLARMFAHYNQHWSEYYGTDKTFVIE